MEKRPKKKPRYLTYSSSIKLTTKNNSHTLAARGIHSPKVYFLYNSQGSEDILALYPNLLDTFFKIIPKLNFEARVLLDSTEKTNLRYSRFEKRKKVEDEINLNLVENMKGNKIKLGDEVHLIHQSTQLYVSLTNSKAPSGLHNLLTLTENISEASIFQIKSPLTFRKTGSLILFGDEFYFANRKKSVVCSIEEKLNFENMLSLEGVGGKKIIRKWKERTDQEGISCPETQKMFCPVLAGNILHNAKLDQYSSEFIATSISFETQTQISKNNFSEFKFGDFVTISKMDDSGISNSLFSECTLPSLKNTILTRIEKSNKSRFLKNIEGVFQILPKSLSQLGKQLPLNPFKEVNIHLKHILTGKLIFFNTKTSKLELMNDFGFYFDDIKERKSKIKNMYEKRKDIYEELMEDDAITDKEEEIKKKFTYAEIKDFGEFDTVCEHEELFDDQYCRDSLLCLRVLSQGDQVLKSSSYFSIRSYHGVEITSVADEEGIENLKEKRKIKQKNFEVNFNYDDDYQLELLKNRSSSTSKETFFYFEKVKNLDIFLLENLSATLQDLKRYLKAGVHISKNASSALRALDYLYQHKNNSNITKNQFQNFLRQSTIVDTFMQILEDIYHSEDISSKNIKLPLKIFNEISKLLQFFIEENEKNSEYLYQWKKFFKKFLDDQKFLHQKVPPFALLISLIFEKTGNYQVYLEYNLESTCQKIQFQDFNHNEFKQFLKMLQTSQKMKNTEIDNLIINTVIHSEHSDKIFLPIELETFEGEKKVQIKVGSGSNLTLNSDFTLTQAFESEYLKNVIKATSVISSLAPNRVFEKISGKFSKEATLYCIKNKDLSEGLRGAFINLYKSLYIQNEITKFELVDVKTDILFDNQNPRYEFLNGNLNKIEEIKKAVFRNQEIDLFKIIFENFDLRKKEFTQNIIDLSIYAIKNSLFGEEELKKIEKIIKKILIDYGHPDEYSHSFRKFVKKGSIQNLSDMDEIDEDDERIIRVSDLQKIDWMAGAIQILLWCRRHHYKEVYDKFAWEDSKKLKIDGEGLRKRYGSADVMALDDESFEGERKRVKEFMDLKKTPQEPYSKVLLELINPSNPELSESILEYIDMLIIRDELTLRNFSKRFSLSGSCGARIQEDFDNVMEICFMGRTQLDVLKLALEQKEIEKSLNQFFLLKGKMKELVIKIYRVIEHEDQMKKNEVTYDVMINNDLTFEDFEISKYDDVLSSETTFFFNILNNFLGKTTNYKNRKEIILDFEIMENLLKMFLKIFNFSQIFNLNLDKLSLNFHEYGGDFKFDQSYTEGNKFGSKLSELLLYSLLIGNFVFLRPSAYNREFLNKVSKDIVKIGEILLTPENKFSDRMILLFLKFIVSVLKDNYSVLVSIDIEVLNFLTKKFSIYMKQKKFKIAIAILEVFEAIVEFRGTGVIENVNLVYYRLIKIINEKNSELRNLIENKFAEWLKKTPTNTVIEKVDLSACNWKSFYSKKANNLGMTKEKPAVYDCAQLPLRIILVTKIFNIFKIFLTSKNPEIESNLKSSFSLGFLLNLLKISSSWYPIKKSIIEFVMALYIKKSIVSGNLLVMTSSLEKELLGDFLKFEKNLKTPSFMDEVMIITHVDSIKNNFLEENVYKPYFGHICWSNNDSFKEYAVKGIGKLLFELMTILEIPGKLKNLDISIFLRYQKIFLKYNKNKGKTGKLLKVEKKGFFVSEKKKNVKKDEFAMRFLEEEETKNDGNLELIDDCKNEYILYDSFLSKEIFSLKKKNYIGVVKAKTLETGLDVQELQILKKKIFKKKFVFSVNQEDYYQFINETLNMLKKEPYKFEIFLKDVVTLMEKKGQNFKKIERKINLLRRIIEKSRNPRSTLITLSEFGLFEKLLNKYSENYSDDKTCLLISKFLTKCLEIARQPIQEEIIKNLENSPTNNFLDAVASNLQKKFDKYVQRRTLKINFKDFYLLSPQDQSDLMMPIQEAEEYYIIHLEMLRWFCEGHFTPLQNFLRVQIHQGKNLLNQVNFIEMMENHLKKFSKLIDVDNYAVGLKILEFIVEMLQGPCKGNQEEVAQLSVIEVLEEMSTTLINGFYFMDEGVKSELLNQIVLIFLGVIENNKNPLANSKVFLSTNADAFWERLIQIQAVFDRNEEYFARSAPKEKLTRDIGKKLAEILEEKEKEEKEEEVKEAASGTNFKAVKKKEKTIIKKNYSEVFDDESIEEVRINQRRNSSKNEDKSEISKIQTESRDEKRFVLGDNKKSNKKDFSHLKMYTDDLTSYSDICFEGINITILFQKLNSYKKSYKKTIETSFKIKKIGRNQKLAKKARSTFFSLVRTIEVTRQDKTLEKVYFALPAITKFHSEDSKNDFNESVDRTSSSAKLSGLTKSIPSMLFEMHHFAKLNKGGSNFGLNMITEIRKFNFILAIIINLTILIFPQINDERDKTGRMQAFDLKNLNFYEICLLALCSIIILSYIVTLILWFLLSYKIEKNLIENFEREELKQSLTPEQLEEIAVNPDSDINKLLKISTIKLFWKLLTSTYLPLLLALLSSALLGVTISKLYLSFLMIDIVTLNPLLKNVIIAFTLKKKSLLVVYIFGVVLIFISTSVSYFSVLRSSMIFIDDDNLEMCYNFIHCFIMTINFGMRSGGGIGEAFLYPSYNDNTKVYLYRTIFDFLFFFAIIVIILEIVFGLIVDSFGELREQRGIKENDQNSKCFICDLKDNVFVKQNISFKEHRKERHNHWNYAYYLIGVLLKDEEDLNGMESYVLERYERGELNWFPVGRAMEVGEEGIEKGVEEKIESIEEKLEFCLEEIQRQESMKEDLGLRDDVDA